MKTFWQVLASLALLTTIAACSGDDHGHPHADDGSHDTAEQHEHGDDSHTHDEKAPETEAYYGDEEQATKDGEAGGETKDEHTHDDGEEHSHH
ncbi:hypothetical protein IDSA_05810 [Pseudidiomarina salinarum]|uniref:Lipoprotein n=1 Tax=Pseudidiomarina salinarum TaxID=435908 RepID=A0A094IW27_9GAMM|nr:hypothetical protein [Pseudidiomarina salinarum]KFZ30059.1 hypothetical protein IDSA_05810 [Pseudidiomarina salinarum]RUO70074.1 hypothetical protein CWI79_00995 [Pseudidiomarina salinarum]